MILANRTMIAALAPLCLPAAIAAPPATRPAIAPTSRPATVAASMPADNAPDPAALRREIDELRERIEQLRRENGALRAQIMRSRSGRGVPAASTDRADSPPVVLLREVAGMSSSQLRRLVGAELQGDGLVDRVEAGTPDAQHCLVHVEQGFSRGRHRRIRCELIMPLDNAAVFRGAAKTVDFGGSVVAAAIAADDPSPGSVFADVSRQPLVIRVADVHAFARELRTTAEPASRGRSVTPLLPSLDGFIPPR